MANEGPISLSEGVTVTLPYVTFKRMEERLRNQNKERNTEIEEAQALKTQMVEVSRQLSVFLTFMYQTDRPNFQKNMDSFNSQSDEMEIFLENDIVRLRFL